MFKPRPDPVRIKAITGGNMPLRPAGNGTPILNRPVPPKKKMNGLAQALSGGM